MGKNLFSVPIFFIVFRETLEAAIIVSVLLGLVEQIIHNDGLATPTMTQTTGVSGDSDSATKDDSGPGPSPTSALVEDDTIVRRRLLRKMRIQIFLGACLGLLIALAIGAAFIAVWFTRASNLWEKSEDLWEGIFSLIAAIMIFAMGISMLKMDRAKIKWRIKLSRAFDGKDVGKRASTGKWVLFVLPLITVLREGMEAVIFVGGVSLGQPATSIPIAAIVGLICGLFCGFVIYQFASRTTLTVFLVVMTNFLLLIGAGLFSKVVAKFEKHAFDHLLGGDVDDSVGSGPGSYRVQGNVWHLDCCTSTEFSGQGWSIFSALFGWSNNASIGTVLAYVFYWLSVVAVLVFMKYKEGRTKFFGIESRAGARRREKRAENTITDDEKVGDEHEVGVLPR